METKIAVFKGKEIRKVIHNNEWWFSVADVVSVLTDSKDSSEYIKKMRKRDDELSKGWVQIVHTLTIETEGGKQRMLCANTEGIFRIIQSIPSPKAEPFKRWLAKVGYERVQEIEDPELATKRTKAIYRAKGYSDNWIEKRMRGIAIRAELTDEWKKRQVGQEREYAILTAEISKATFGLSPSTQGAQGFDENRTAARKGGKIAGDAREKLEKETKKMVVSKENYLCAPEKRKRLEKK